MDETSEQTHTIMRNRCRQSIDTHLKETSVQIWEHQSNNLGQHVLYTNFVFPCFPNDKYGTIHK